MTKKHAPAGNSLQTISTFASDLLVVLRGIWLLLIFDLLALFAFVKTDQGTDVIRSIIEDLGSRMIRPGTFIWLIFSLLAWSIASAFSCRWMVYLTDNSGRSLSLERVDQRKKIQAGISYISLFFPFLMILLALWRCVTSKDAAVFNTSEQIAIGAMLVTIALSIQLIHLLYVEKIRLPLGWFREQGAEKEWTTKLYGIFNDVRIDMSVEEAGQYADKNDLPTDIPLPNGIVLPAHKDAPWTKKIVNQQTFFQLVKTYPKQDVRHGQPYVWMYRIPLRLYLHILRQLFAFTIAAVVIILLFTLLPAHCFFNVGTAAIICFAFASWQIIVVFIRYLDHIKTRWRVPVPIRFLLLLLFIISSFCNNDHPVRTLGRNIPARMQLSNHFEKWLVQLQNDSNRYHMPGDSVVPVIFVAAEGGALRTGAFTAMTLAKLADRNPFLAKHIYCYSTVSGGTVGANFFNALYTYEKRSATKPDHSGITVSFFKKDFLSAVIDRLVFGEIINYFIPFHINRMDRAIALEKEWEAAWDETVNKNNNLLSGSFNNNIDSIHLTPAVFINTTEVETGMQSVWSNVALSELPDGDKRDLVNMTRQELCYSTAINLSSRFPLISPGAAFQKDSLGRALLRHYVDGGYYENKGAETLLQVLQVLTERKDKKIKIKPYVIQFNFGDSTGDQIQPVRKFNEITEIITGIYHTRDARAELQQRYLSKFIHDQNGIFTQAYLPLSSKRFPMNWVLSNAAMDTMNRYLDTHWDSLFHPSFPDSNWKLKSQSTNL